MTDKEDVNKTTASEKSPFRAMRDNIEYVLEAGKKAVNEAGSDSDTDADSDINISLKTFDKPEEKELEDNEPRISLADAMRAVNEAFEKEVTDAVRIKQQKEAVEKSESRTKAAVAEFGAISGCCVPEGPEIDF